MPSEYYKPCIELDKCCELIEKYFNTQQYDLCFKGYLKLAEKEYPLAECQVGYFYLEGLGVDKDLSKAFYWTQLAANHGDRDGQYNLAWFYENGIGISVDIVKAKFWYKKSAAQNHNLAINKCNELGIKII